MRPALALVVFVFIVGTTARAAAQPGQPPPGAPAPPGADQASSEPRVLAEIRVHGNHTTPDAEVSSIAGLTIGQVLKPADVEAARQRLRESGRFEEVEIRARSRSLSGGGDVSLIIVVREHPIPDRAIETTPVVLRPFRRLFGSGMFLPILQYADGYGFTYGGRFTFVDTLGRGGRLSVPMSWGGTKRVALEADRPLSRGPVDRLTASASIWRRTNPYFDQDEDRRELTASASRRIADHLVLSAQGALARVDFGTLRERLGSYGARVVADTRMDPVFPRNAVYASLSWTALVPEISARARRVQAEVRAYRGLLGQSVLSLRWQYSAADARLPPYERALLGGAGTLRGYRAGSFAGDNLMAASAEVRVPITSPMGISRVGFSVFADAGTVWDHGTRLADATLRRGAGAGFFVLASVFQLDLDLGFRPGGARLHFSTGLQF